MSNGIFRIMKPRNEAVLGYLPGSDEKRGLKARLAELKQSPIEIPMIIGGKEVRSGRTGTCVIPHNHAHVLATYHMAGEEETRMAVQAALEAGKAWARTPWDHRLAVFLRAAELIAGPWRHTLNAATMLGQSKTVYEADADAACELMDFFRYNSYFLRQILEEQPECPQGILNRMEYRPLEGFVFAVTPFNFTAIGGNLPGTPAMAGNTVVWKPASTAVYSNYQVMKLLQAAGLPDGVINFIPGPGSAVGPLVMNHPMLAGIHFTGSTAVFQEMWRTIAKNLERYNGYPRIVGETGGKDFVFAHPSADIDALVAALIGGAFSYQGQKCSATSRVYIPRSIWPAVKIRLLDNIHDPIVLRVDKKCCPYEVVHNADQGPQSGAPGSEAVAMDFNALQLPDAWFGPGQDLACARAVEAGLYAAHLLELHGPDAELCQIVGLGREAMQQFWAVGLKISMQQARRHRRDPRPSARGSVPGRVRRRCRGDSALRLHAHRALHHLRLRVRGAGTVRRGPAPDRAPRRQPRGPPGRLGSREWSGTPRPSIGNSIGMTAGRRGCRRLAHGRASRDGENGEPRRRHGARTPPPRPASPGLSRWVWTSSDFSVARHRRVLELRFGVVGEALTLADTARRLGASQSTVHRWEHEAIEQARALLDGDRTTGLSGRSPRQHRRRSWSAPPSRSRAPRRLAAAT